MINDGERGNAVPPICSSLMGIETHKKSGGHPEYRTAFLLFFHQIFPQADEKKHLIACNEFWKLVSTRLKTGLKRPCQKMIAILIIKGLIITLIMNIHRNGF